MEWRACDGDKVVSGQVLGVLHGSARSILVAERIMLNFMQVCGREPGDGGGGTAHRGHAACMARPPQLPTAPSSSRSRALVRGRITGYWGWQALVFVFVLRAVIPCAVLITEDERYSYRHRRHGGCSGGTAHKGAGDAQDGARCGRRAWQERVGAAEKLRKAT